MPGDSGDVGGCQGDEQLCVTSGRHGVHLVRRIVRRYDGGTRCEARSIGCPDVDARRGGHPFDERVIGTNGHEVTPLQFVSGRRCRAARTARRRCLPPARTATRRDEGGAHDAQAGARLPQATPSCGGRTCRGIEAVDDFEIAQAGHASDARGVGRPRHPSRRAACGRRARASHLGKRQFEDDEFDDEFEDAGEAGAVAVSLELEPPRLSVR